jgi:hypothetical protein
MWWVFFTCDAFTGGVSIGASVGTLVWNDYEDLHDRWRMF